MNFAWRDYNPETMGFVEEWIDEVAVKMTGMEDGFRQEYEYWSNEDYNVVGDNYWCTKKAADVKVCCFFYLKNNCELLTFIGQASSP